MQARVSPTDKIRVELDAPSNRAPELRRPNGPSTPSEPMHVISSAAVRAAHHLRTVAQGSHPRPKALRGYVPVSEFRRCPVFSVTGQGSVRWVCQRPVGTRTPTACG